MKTHSYFSTLVTISGVFGRDVTIVERYYRCLGIRDSPSRRLSDIHALFRNESLKHYIIVVFKNDITQTQARN